jgi:hypothetical protein
MADPVGPVGQHTAVREAGPTALEQLEPTAEITKAETVGPLVSMTEEAVVGVVREMATVEPVGMVVFTRGPMQPQDPQARMVVVVVAVVVAHKRRLEQPVVLDQPGMLSLLGNRGDLV